jgi:hypothetical protein
VQIVIVGRDLPGRSFLSDGKSLDQVHVGVQVRAAAEQLVAGDAPSARWVLQVKHSTEDDGSVDFKGPAVHGKRGERFLYLTWGNLGAAGTFAMFRRAKLMLNRVDPALVEAAATDDRPLVAQVQLTDERGGPRCARVDPPAVEWSLG